MARLACIHLKSPLPRISPSTCKISTVIPWSQGKSPQGERSHLWGISFTNVLNNFQFRIVLVLHMEQMMGERSSEILWVPVNVHVTPSAFSMAPHGGKAPGSPLFPWVGGRSISLIYTAHSEISGSPLSSWLCISSSVKQRNLIFTVWISALNCEW